MSTWERCSVGHSVPGDRLRSSSEDEKTEDVGRLLTTSPRLPNSSESAGETYPSLLQCFQSYISRVWFEYICGNHIEDGPHVIITHPVMVEVDVHCLHRWHLSIDVLSSFSIKTGTSEMIALQVQGDHPINDSRWIYAVAIGDYVKSFRGPNKFIPRLFVHSLRWESVPQGDVLSKRFIDLRDVDDLIHQTLELLSCGLARWSLSLLNSFCTSK